MRLGFGLIVIWLLGSWSCVARVCVCVCVVVVVCCVYCSCLVVVHVVVVIRYVIVPPVCV